jgi:hypothetical protein
MNLWLIQEKKKYQMNLIPVLGTIPKSNVAVLVSEVDKRAAFTLFKQS